jgi:hypothetical protein
VSYFLLPVSISKSIQVITTKIVYCYIGSVADCGTVVTTYFNGPDNQFYVNSRRIVRSATETGFGTVVNCLLTV